MQRALDLAQLGKGRVAPNPRVGAVVVFQDQIIGEGYHQQYGGPHAEVNAIRAVKDLSLLAKSTLYVNLEPCSHFGKTPPCADLILEYKIPRVVICNLDPFEKVNGGGINRLQENGVEVVHGVLAEKGEKINQRFFSFHRKQRPFIILKWAQTLDGFISRETGDKNFDDNWISNPLSKQLVHQWRAEEDAILVGKNTAKLDNPALNCREVSGSDPIRMVVDAKNELNPELQIFKGEAKTFLLNRIKSEKSGNLEWVKCSLGDQLISEFNKVCFEANIQSVIVEGGANILNQFIASNMWDEARVFVGQKKFESGIPSPKISAFLESKENIEGDLLSIYSNSSQ